MACRQAEWIAQRFGQFEKLLGQCSRVSHVPTHYLRVCLTGERREEFWGTADLAGQLAGAVIDVFDGMRPSDEGHGRTKDELQG
jgi:hypothetical protein